MADPSPKQAESIAHANQRVNIWEGSVRSGKTIASLIRWMIFAANGPPGALMMVGKTERSLKRNVLDVLGPEIKVRSGAGEATIFGRTVYLGGAADETAEQKIRGLTLVGAYGDELVTWPEAFFNQLQQRLSARGAKFFGTSNADSPSHWLKQKWIDRQPDERRARFHFGLRDNPYLDEGYIVALERDFSGLWKKRFIDGLWVLAAGAIYDMWAPEKHVVAQMPTCTRHWVGIDYGTATVFAALLFGLGLDNRVYVKSELRWDARRQGRQKTDAEYSNDVRDWLIAQQVNPDYVWVDPSATSFLLQLYRDKVNWPISPSIVEGDNDVDDGLRTVARTLSTDRLKVHESCEGLIEEFPGYVWDDKVQLKGEKDRPVKLNDHSLDACRYGVFSSMFIWDGLPVESPRRAA